jgi:preprotein translocase subunit YajC
MTATLIAYRTPPQMERKALAEAREAGHRAYLPREPRDTKAGARRVPTARGYVFAEGRPAEAEHIKNAIGPVSRTELRRLYVRTSKTQRKHAFAPGDKVVSASGYPGTVRRVHGSGRYDVEVVIAHKPCVVKMKESDITRAHPHT